MDSCGAVIARGFCENCGWPIINAVIGSVESDGIKSIKAKSLDDYIKDKNICK